MTDITSFGEQLAPKVMWHVWVTLPIRVRTPAGFNRTEVGKLAIAELSEHGLSGAKINQIEPAIDGDHGELLFMDVACGIT